MKLEERKEMVFSTKNNCPYLRRGKMEYFLGRSKEGSIATIGFSRETTQSSDEGTYEGLYIEGLIRLEVLWGEGCHHFTYVVNTIRSILGIV